MNRASDIMYEELIMNNERGGILSKLLIAPIGIALMVGFFFLGYYVGKYQSKSGSQSELMPPLPDVAASQNPPAKKEEFTFYKTLSDKNEKTVSIDLKPKNDEPKQEKKQEVQKEAPKKAVIAEAPKPKPAEPKKEKQLDIKIEKKASAAAKSQVQAKKEAPAAASKGRYTLQLASYAEKSPADEDVRRMKQKGYAAFVVAGEVAGKGTWYRVRLGSFTNKSAAEKLQKDLSSKENISAILLQE